MLGKPISEEAYPTRALLGRIFLSDTWVTLRTLLPGALGKGPGSAHLAKGPGFPNTFSSDPTLCWSQQPSLGSSSFGIETKAHGFL